MRSVDWQMMPFFLAVARAGSLRSAAQLLGVNYGTLNRNVQALEASYGAQLFRRSRKGFALTEAGQTLLPLAVEGEETLQRARLRIEGLDRTETGKIRFSLPQMLAYDVVAPIISKFQHIYPDIQIELRLTSAVESIASGETDVALRAAPEIDGDVVRRKLYSVAASLYASKSYIRDVFPGSKANGEGLSYIGLPGDLAVSCQSNRSKYPGAKIRHVVADGYMRLNLLRRNCGMAYLPVIFEGLFPDICRVPGAETTLERPLWIVRHEELGRTVRVRRFVDFLAEELLKIQPEMQGELYQR